MFPSGRCGDHIQLYDEGLVKHVRSPDHMNSYFCKIAGLGFCAGSMNTLPANRSRSWFTVAFTFMNLSSDSARWDEEKSPKTQDET